MQFCDNNSADQSFHQLYDDAAGRTRAVLRAYLEEILPLFPDSHFFLMGDETHAVAPCSLDNIAGLERAMRGYLVDVAGKVFGGAQETGPRFCNTSENTTGVLRPGDVFMSWKGVAGACTAQAAAARGYQVVELDGPRLYLDHPKGVGPPANLSWSALDSYWHNATEGYTDAQRANVHNSLCHPCLLPWDANKGHGAHTACSQDDVARALQCHCAMFTLDP